MKISAQEEYGLRILLRIAKINDEEGLSIAQLSEEEGLSVSYVAKLTRILRMQGYIASTRGPKGGYILATQPSEIMVNELLKALGGALYDDEFCNNHTGGLNLCTNSVDCSARSLWRIIQLAIDRVLEKVNLQDLMGNEYNADNLLQKILEEQILKDFDIK